jgi:hypothetical protein
VAGVVQELGRLDAETAGAVQDALAPGALVDHAIRAARIGQVSEPGDRQLDEEHGDLPRV